MKKKKMFMVILGFVGLVLMLCLLLPLFKKGEEVENEVLSIKEAYESLNGKDGYIDVIVNEDNPYVIKDEDSVIKVLSEKSGIVLFASHKSNLSRSIINVLSESAVELNYDAISYFDVSNIRDELALDGNHNVIMKKDGTKSYKKMVSILGEKLTPYVLENTDGTKVNTGEKRIYLGTVVAVYNGEIVDVHSISMDEGEVLSESKKNSLKEIYKTMIESVTSEVCNDAC